MVRTKRQPCTVTTEQLFALAIQYHQAGRFGEAEALYRQILAQTPEDPAVHANLGDVCKATGRIEEARASFRRALEIRPDFAEAHYNLGNLWSELGQWDAAVNAFSQALRCRASYAEAAHNLGMALVRLGRRKEAIAAYGEALRFKPNSALIYNSLGIALKEQGQVGDAIEAYQRALLLRPTYAEAHYHLAHALTENGEIEEAMNAYRRALGVKPELAEARNNLGHLLTEWGLLDEAIGELRTVLRQRPDYAEAHNNMGNAFWNRNERAEAMASYREAIRSKPGYLVAYHNLGNALREEGRLDEAAALCEEALKRNPEDAETRNTLGNVRKDQGLLEAALAEYRGALGCKPGWAQVHSNVIFTMHLREESDGAIFDEQQRWNRQFAEPLRDSILPHRNDRSPERRLRIGYVSPDFRSHAVAFFLAPLFEAHDHTACEIHCYSDARRPDAVTARLREAADAWHEVRRLTDAELAERVGEDGIDILVDLAMHTANNRLLTFARKPAPVQVSWLAYPGTTGLETMDYRLTDAWIDPAETEGKLSGEEAIRLPDAWCCYAPILPFHEVCPLEAQESGKVTFGALNQFCKVDEKQLDYWSRLLGTVAQSRLLMICPEGQTRDRVRSIFAGNGIAHERVELVGRCDWSEYACLFQRIDLALDTFPCNGMTTTCHALWMGVPVITREGSRAVSRAGGSLLRNVGLPEFIATDEEDFIRIAVEWAGDLPRLAGLRRTLRAQMQASPLMDASRFARKVEAAYRIMWLRWCARV